MADEIKKEVIVDIRIEKADNEKQVDTLTKRITALKVENADLLKINKELEKQGKANTKEYIDNAKQIEINKQKITENTASRKSLITTIQAEDNSIKALNARNRELIKQRNEISTATAEGRAKIALLNKEIDQNTEKIKANSSAHEKQRFNIGNYKSALDGLRPGLGSAIEQQGEMITTMSRGALVLGGVTAAAGALFAAYAKSTTGAKDLAKAQDVLSSATDIVTESFGEWIASISGQDSNGGIGLLERLTTGLLSRIDPLLAIHASLKAQAKELMRELEISQRFAQAFYKEDERRAELQRRIRDDETRSITERLAAAAKVEKFMENAGDRQVTVLQAQVQAIKDSTTNFNQNREAQLKVAELEAEIADKREEITGKLTENAMAVKQLTAEYAELQRNIRIETLDRELMAQHDAFVKSYYGIFQERQWLRDQEEGAIKDFNRRLIKETEERNKKELEATKKRLKEEEDARNALSNAGNEALSEVFGIRENFITTKMNDELSLVESTEKAKLEAIKRNLKRGVITEKQAQAEREKVTRESEEKQKDIKRKAFESNKKLQIAETLVNTFQAAVAAYKALVGIPIVGPALAAIAAGVATAFGYSRIRSIESQAPGFASGGLTGTKIMHNHGTPINRSNGDNRLATVKTGEVILNERQQAALGGDATFRRIGVPGFAEGGPIGFTGQQESRLAHSAAMASEQARQLVQTVLILQDFEAAMATKNSPIARAKVI